MMAYQHHTRQQKGNNIRKIVSTHSSRRRGTLTNAHHQQAEVRRKWEGPSPLYRLGFLGFDAYLIEGLIKELLSPFAGLLVRSPAL